MPVEGIARTVNTFCFSCLNSSPAIPNHRNEGGTKLKSLGSFPRCYQRPLYSMVGTLCGSEDQLGLYISSEVKGVDINFLVDPGLAWFVQLRRVKSFMPFLHAALQRVLQPTEERLTVAVEETATVGSYVHRRRGPRSTGRTFSSQCLVL